MPFLVVPMLKVNDKRPIDAGDCGLSASQCPLLRFPLLGLSFSLLQAIDDLVEIKHWSESRRVSPGCFFSKVYHLMHPVV